MLQFVFVDHFRPAVYAALLFALGLFLSWPVVEYRMTFLCRWPMALFRFVMRLMGPAPGITRVIVIICGFNSAVMFACMASGIHPALPKALAVWTGMNVGIIMGLARRGEEMPGPRALAPGEWRAPPALALACGLATLMLELPCFWYAIAMGISLGDQVQHEGTLYLAALLPRVQAFARVIAPLLLASAIAEAIAMRAPLPDQDAP